MAVVGLYGVMAYSVARRTREIGIRIATGAQKSDILLLIMRQIMLQVTAGILLGIFCAAVPSGLLKSMLYGVKPQDPNPYVISAILLGLAAMLAAYLPARRVTRVDLVSALRHE